MWIFGKLSISCVKVFASISPHMVYASALRIWHSLFLNHNCHVILQIAWQLNVQRTVHSQYSQ